MSGIIAGYNYDIFVSYRHAHDLLRKGWELRTKNSIYDHQAYLHLEAAKKLLLLNTGSTQTGISLQRFCVCIKCL